jgi:hypothetical protein
MLLIYAVLQSAAAIAETFIVSNATELQTALTTAATNGVDDILDLDPVDFIATSTFTYDSSESNSLSIIGDGKSATYLKGNVTNQVLRINTSATSNAHIAISDLTIAHGNVEGQSGGGLYLFTSNSNITIERCGFVGNSSSGYGGGAYITLGGFLSENNTVSINDCTFNRNSAYNGAGLYLNVYNPMVTVEGNRFSRNDLDDPGRGGGAYIESGWGPITVANNWFERNFNGTMGAGLYLYAGGMENPVVVEGNVFKENRLYNGGMGAGAYVSSLDRPFRFVGNILQENTVDGPSATADGGGGLYAWVVGSIFSSCTILNNAFVGNESPVTGTAAWISSDTASILFANNTVAYNSSLHLYNPASTAVRMDGPGAEIYNNIFWGNVFGVSLKVQEDAWLPVELFNNIIPYENYDLPPSTSMGGNKIDNPALGRFPDYHISALGSPAIDEGLVYTGLPQFDIDGEARQIDGDENGTTVVDIGADEVGGIVTLSPLRYVFEVLEEQGNPWNSKGFEVKNIGIEDISIVDTTLENYGPYGDVVSPWYIPFPLTGTVLHQGDTAKVKVGFSRLNGEDSSNKLIVETSIGTLFADLIGDYIPLPSNDIDRDGVTNEEEQGPGEDDPFYDGNCDFVPDWEQENVTSLFLTPSGQYATIVAPVDQIGTGDTYPDDVHPLLSNVAKAGTGDESGGPTLGREYPYGLFEFEVSTSESIAGGGGGSFPVTIILPSDGPRINGYVKRMPTTDGEGLHNYNFTHRSLDDFSDIPEELADLVGAWYEDVTFIDNSVPPLDPPPPCVGETHQVIHLMLRDGLFGDFDQTANGKVKDPGGPAIIPVDDDADDDGLPDDQDNCPNTPNPGQEDTYPPQGNGIGDACDCESDFNCDGNVDAGDVTDFLTDFGRSTFFNPCTNANPCNGDVDCNVNVDADDVTLFLEDFGRSQFFNPCPTCVAGAWCIYP